MLVNNNYSNTVIDNLIHKFINGKQKPRSNETENSIKVYYQAQMHNNYKIDEKIINDIVKKNTKCADPKQKLKFIIYYKNPPTSNLVMKNNLTAPNSPLQQTNVVYQFTCPNLHCQAERYIGMTQTTLLRRLDSHTRNGSILDHFINIHNIKPSKAQLTENTKIIARAKNRYQLAIKEALFILRENPSLNKQSENFTGILNVHTNRKSYLPLIRNNKINENNDIRSDNVNDNHDRSILIYNDLSTPNDTNVKSLPSETQEKTSLSTILDNVNTQDEIPDMNVVLSYFGINVENLKTVPLEHSNSNDSHNISHIPNPDPGDISDDSVVELHISQRIKTLVRRARHDCT